MTEEKTKPVRIDAELLPPVDKAVEGIKDEFGIQKYPSRRALIDAAVKDFLRKHLGRAS